MANRNLSTKVTTSLVLVLLLSLATAQGRLLQQTAARQGSSTAASSTPYAETMRSVTPSSRSASSNAASTKPPGVVSIDSSTSMADTQQTQTLRSVTPSGYAPLSQSQRPGTVSTDQATVTPTRPTNGAVGANMQSSTTSGASNQRMESIADTSAAMSMRQVP